MDRIILLKNRIEELPNVLPELLRETFTEIAPMVEDQVTAQLDRGLKADGTSLPDYSPVSVEVYGKPAGAIRLYDQGDFWKGITCEVSAEGIDIVGVDIKTEMLVFHYGEEILGLTEESLEIIKNDYAVPVLLEKIGLYLLAA